MTRLNTIALQMPSARPLLLHPFSSWRTQLTATPTLPPSLSLSLCNFAYPLSLALPDWSDRKTTSGLPRYGCKIYTLASLSLSLLTYCWPPPIRLVAGHRVSTLIPVCHNSPACSRDTYLPTRLDYPLTRAFLRKYF